MTDDASGRYVYLCDGDAVPVDETFAIASQERGLVVSSVRTAPGTRLDVETVYAPDGGTIASLTWASGVEGTTPAASVTYRLTAEGGGLLTDTAGSQHLIEMPADASFFPLMRVFSGRSLAKVVAGGDAGAAVLTPDIRDPRATERWLLPLVDQRRAAAVVEGTLEVDGVHHACRIIEYLGGSYDQPATVWLDSGGLLLRYTWDQPGVGAWDVRLRDVDGSWPKPVMW